MGFDYSYVCKHASNQLEGFRVRRYWGASETYNVVFVSSYELFEPRQNTLGRSDVLGLQCSPD